MSRKTDCSFYFADPLPFGLQRLYDDASERIYQLQSWNKDAPESSEESGS